MKIQQFDGGLATRQRPQFLSTNEATIYNNIDSRVGSLAPVKAKEATTETLEAHHTFYVAGNQWVSAALLTDYVEFAKKLYSTDRSSAPKVFDGINTYNLGIVPPPQLTGFTLIAYPEAVKEVTFSPDTAASGLPLEETKYILVNVDGSKQSVEKEVVIDAQSRVSSPSTVPGYITFFQQQQAASSLYPTGYTPFYARPDPGADEQAITISNPVGIVIGATGVKVFRLYQGAYYLVGTLSTSSDSVLDNVHDISTNEVLTEDDTGPIHGVVQYALTYTSAEGIESAPSSISAELDLSTTGSIDLTGLPVSSDPQVTGRKLYRIGGDITAFTQVATLDNIVTTLSDTTADIDAEGSLLETIGDAVAPTGLAFLTDSYAMLFGAVGTQLRFTKIGEPWNWPVLQFIQYEAPITGIAATANGILVFTEFRTHLVTGTGPASLATQLLSGDQGCIAFESVVNISNAALWVSSDGVCTSDGSQVVLISQDKLGKIILAPVASVVYDEVYYTIDVTGQALAFDFGIGKIFKQFDLGVQTLEVANDKLYGWSDGVLYELFKESAESLHYKSPRFIEGRVSELKTYKKVYIYSKGDIIINIIIDDKVVMIKELNVAGGTTIQVPQEKQRGYFIQFEIAGTGEVLELEYTVGGRQNG